MAPMTAVTIRRFNALEEYFACEALQQEVWGFEDLSVVPAHLLVTFDKRGGLVLGAFDRDVLVGFVYGFVGQQYGMATHNSVMSAVRPQYRNQGIAHRLKLAQRKAALAQGFSLMTWTFDPLQALNAHFNLTKLGVVIREHYRNVYGPFRDAINRDMPTDRFGVEWWMDRPRALARLEREPPQAAPPIPANRPQLGPAGLLVPGEGAPGGEGEALHLGIPLSIDELRKRDPELALHWRHHLRDWLEPALDDGYVICGFCVDRQRRLGVYTLRRADVQDLLMEAT